MAKAERPMRLLGICKKFSTMEEVHQIFFQEALLKYNLHAIICAIFSAQVYEF